jgi:hypothetical protein
MDLDENDVRQQPHDARGLKMLPAWQSTNWMDALPVAEKRKRGRMKAG